MKWLFSVLCFISIPAFSQQKNDTMHIYNYLALGDSYTIGEAVLLHQSFPYQAVQILRNAGYDFQAPEIIAKTGWTTDELEEAVKHYRFLPKYDYVTLLVGVNNQYRGREAIEYKHQFEGLLQKAIGLANGKKDHVIIVSIPDYSVTPYAANSDREKIAREIDSFNGINKALSIQYKVQYMEITEGLRDAANDATLLASDGLHPSEKEYAKWAAKLAELITSLLK
jgi:lysophospholipase L1-like esterase